MAEMLWHGWRDLVRVLLMGALSYVYLIALLRVTGNRTLSKMNAFDLVVTVALGSTFATVLLSEEVSLVEGTTALTVLVLMQFAVAWLSPRSAAVESLVKSQPTVLVWRGELLRDTMRRERITEAEALAACRQKGVASLDEVAALVLETTGDFSLLRAEGPLVANDRATLRTATNYRPPDPPADPG